MAGSLSSVPPDVIGGEESYEHRILTRAKAISDRSGHRGTIISSDYFLAMAVEVSDKLREVDATLRELKKERQS